MGRCMSRGSEVSNILEGRIAFSPFCVAVHPNSCGDDGDLAIPWVILHENLVALVPFLRC